MQPLLAFAAAVSLAADSTDVLRVNQVGYLPDAPKVGVLCALGDAPPSRYARFVVRDDAGRTVLGPRRLRPDAPFGPCRRTWRLDFSAVRRAGAYTIVAGGVTARVRIGPRVFAGGADTLLQYMRE